MLDAFVAPCGREVAVASETGKVGPQHIGGAARGRGAEASHDDCRAHSSCPSPTRELMVFRASCSMERLREWLYVTLWRAQKDRGLTISIPAYRWSTRRLPSPVTTIPAPAATATART